IKYPIGQQDFKLLRESGSIYIDKTRYIQEIAESGSKYYFLARPRRFGKSLFLSTLQYFFEGRRDLFKGLYIDTYNWDWMPHPVLRLDLNTDKFMDMGILDEVLLRNFNRWEEKYDIEHVDYSYTQRFAYIIEQVHQKTGREVVILVDEYDKPLVGNINRHENLEYYREKLASLYSNFKSSAEHIRLVFLTGVSRFSKLSVFSDLNNLNDITFDTVYSDICGITEKELNANFKEGIKLLGEKNKWSYEETCMMLKRNYDGYRFTEEGSDIYNPWSLLNCLQKKKIDNYWVETGKATLIAETLKMIDVDLEKTFDSYCMEKDLKGLDLLNPNAKALLFQTGYLTIKDYLQKFRRYRLGIPNEEVKAGLFEDLLPFYVKTKRSTPNEVISDVTFNFNIGRPDEAMYALQTYFAGIDYELKMENENNFHNAFFLLMDLMGLETKAEYHTSDGSIDILIKTQDFIYIIELKYDHSAESAIHQIEKKQYARPFNKDIRKLFKIGVSFSSKTRCIEDWIIQ
ncbi:MAG: ATP-binding protein, partial [Muribaculaceae bacterium]|nr:ATP-binding protein [Muribaculaceae bacterium]